MQVKGHNGTIELRDAGVVNSEEFDTAKVRLLGDVAS